MQETCLNLYLDNNNTGEYLQYKTVEINRIKSGKNSSSYRGVWLDPDLSFPDHSTKFNKKYLLHYLQCEKKIIIYNDENLILFLFLFTFGVFVHLYSFC